MATAFDELNKKTQQAIADAHDPALIQVAKKFSINNGLPIFHIFGKDKPPVLVARNFKGLENKPVSFLKRTSQVITSGAAATPKKTDPSPWNYGILIGATGTDQTDLVGIIYSPDDKSLYTDQVKNITLEAGIPTTAMTMKPIVDFLLANGYVLKAKKILPKPNDTAYFGTFLIPYQGSRYKFYFNIMEIERTPRRYFSLGVEISSEEETSSTLSIIRQVNSSLKNILPAIPELEGLFPYLPKQIAITPLIPLDKFLQKYNIEDVIDCGKIIKFYAYDMAINNFTNYNVHSITSEASLFPSIQGLKEKMGSKGEAEETYEKGVQEKVNFEAYKGKLTNFICNQGFNAVNLKGANFVFYDNPVYKAIIKTVLEPSMTMAKQKSERASFYQHKIILGRLCAPPFFIDVDDRVLLPADAYMDYLSMTKIMGKPGAPEDPSQIRNQNEWLSFAGALEEMSGKKNWDPNSAAILLNLALI